MKKQTSATTETGSKGRVLIDYEGKIIQVGIDVHEKDWQVAAFYQGVTLGNHRMGASSEILIRYLRRQYSGATLRCVYESSAWGFNLQRALTAAGISCIVVHAADVSGSHKEKANKTDKVDALMLARQHANGTLKEIYVPDERLQKQRNLIRQRARLVSDLTRAKNRIKSLLKFQGIAIPVAFERTKWSNLFIKWLEQEAARDELLGMTLELMIEQVKLLRQLLLKAERKLRDLTKTCFEDNARLMRTVPGIGRTTAILLLMELGDMRRFKTFDQLNSFVGFYPGSHSTGDKERDTGLINRRNTAVRSALVEAAWIAVRTDPVMLDAFVELKKRMEANEAIIRIARKLLRRIRSVMLRKESYEKGLISSSIKPKQQETQK